METGNDLFFVIDAGDLAIELAGGGAETIIVSVNMTMPDQVEVLQIASGISGITITGGAGNDMKPHAARQAAFKHRKPAIRACAKKQKFPSLIGSNRHTATLGCKPG
jgi:hypothetical protein